MHHWIRINAGVAGLLCLVATVSRADWPQFRGPTGQGLAEKEKVPLHWSDSENITWKQKVPGVAWSSPVVQGNRIYLTTAVDVTEPESEEPHIELGAMCLETESGRPLWSKTLFHQLGEVEIHKKNSHASPTPVVEGDALYVHFGPHGTAKLTTDGDVIWTTKLPYLPTHGNGGSPAVAEDLLIFCCDGHDQQYVAGVEKETGKVRWKTERGLEPQKGFSFSTPLVITVNGQAQAICPGSDAVCAYDPATGQEIWRVLYEGGYSVIPRPVYGNGLVYVCTGYNKPLLLAIDPTGQGDVTDSHVRWTVKKQVPHSSSLLLVGNYLYFVSDRGIASCVDALTGEPQWEERLGGNYSASPLYASGRIYFQDENGTATVVAASPEFQKLARNILTDDERTYASYAVSNGALFIRSEGHLFRIDEDTDSGDSR